MMDYYYHHIDLPTEAEWEFAALGNVGNTEEENTKDRKYTLGQALLKKMDLPKIKVK